jgi:hypothetical protein
MSKQRETTNDDPDGQRDYDGDNDGDVLDYDDHDDDGATTPWADQPHDTTRQCNQPTRLVDEQVHHESVRRTTTEEAQQV